MVRGARFMVALHYAAGLCIVAALVVGVIYFTLSLSLEVEQTETREVGGIVDDDSVAVMEKIDSPVDVEVRTVERRIAKDTLTTLRNASIATLAVLFVLSFGIGWAIAGRVLAPIAWSVGVQRRFVQDASHELRNPLAVIRTTLDVALEDPDTTPEAWRKTGVGALASVGRMAAIVDKLLRLVRDEVPATDGKVFDPANLLQSVGRQVEQSAATRDVTVAVAATPGRVTGNPEAIERAVANVVDNALRYAPSGTTVRIDGVSTSYQYEIRVRDRGPGIPEDKVETVFERGHRSRASPGLGLGLSLAREIVDSHYGAIRVERTGPDGTTFFMRLPTTRDR